MILGAGLGMANAALAAGEDAGDGLGEALAEALADGLGCAATGPAGGLELALAALAAVAGDGCEGFTALTAGAGGSLAEATGEEDGLAVAARCGDGLAAAAAGEVDGMAVAAGEAVCCLPAAAGDARGEGLAAAAGEGLGASLGADAAAMDAAALLPLALPPACCCAPVLVLVTTALGSRRPRSWLSSASAWLAPLLWNSDLPNLASIELPCGGADAPCEGAAPELSSLGRSPSPSVSSMAGSADARGFDNPEAVPAAAADADAGAPLDSRAAALDSRLPTAGAAAAPAAAAFAAPEEAPPVALLALLAAAGAVVLSPRRSPIIRNVKL